MFARHYTGMRAGAPGLRASACRTSARKVFPVTKKTVLTGCAGVLAGLLFVGF